MLRVDRPTFGFVLASSPVGPWIVAGLRAAPALTVELDL
jgi:hypothetical protein